jgi:hypothetical protein
MEMSTCLGRRKPRLFLAEMVCCHLSVFPIRPSHQQLVRDLSIVGLAHFNHRAQRLLHVYSAALSSSPASGRFERTPLQDQRGCLATLWR